MDEKLIKKMAEQFDFFMELVFDNDLPPEDILKEHGHIIHKISEGNKKTFQWKGENVFYIYQHNEDGKVTIRGSFFGPYVAHIEWRDQL